MNYYMFNIGDWAKKCAHLTMLETGAYRRLLDWYYANEQPLPVSMEAIFDCVIARGTWERKTVKKIVEKFFTLHEDGWHQEHCDDVLARSRNRQLRDAERDVTRDASVTGVTPDRRAIAVASRHRATGTASRSARYRTKREWLFAALMGIGHAAPPHLGNPALARLCKQHGINLDIWDGDECDVTPRRDETRDVTEKVTRSDTVSITPLAIRGDVGTYPSPPPQLDPERVGAAVRVLRDSSLPTNGGNPLLLELLAEGVTDEELRLVACEAAAKGKSFAWVVAAIRGRRNDALRPVKTFKQKADEEHLRRWAPELLPKGKSL